MQSFTPVFRNLCACAHATLRLVRTGFGITGLAVLGLLGAGLAEARPAKEHSPARLMERKRISVETSPLNSFAQDSVTLLPEIRWENLPAGSTGVVHAIAILQDTDPGVVAAQLQTVLDLAGNYGLVIEHHFGSAARDRVGIVVSPPFPRMTFHWEAHPYESVPQTNGLWRSPFADTGDVMAVESHEGQTLIQFEAAATTRIDHTARRQGHRRYRIRIDGPAGPRVSPPCIWMPGLGRVAWPAEPGAAPGADWSGLSEAFKVRRSAREKLANALGLGPEASWSVTSAVSGFRESAYLWLVPSPSEPILSPYYAPGFSTDADSATWVPLAVGAWSDVVTPLPARWRVEGAAVISDSEASLALKDGGDGARGDEFTAFLRRHRGREAALLLEGQVLGVVPLSDFADGHCLLATLSHEANRAILNQWEEARGAFVGPAEHTASTATPEDVPTDGELDFFQVRLMAEPQDRELIPVTHFAAPGGNQGVVVAVQNEIILDSRAITGARLERDSDRLLLHLSLTDEGREALADACFTHLGKQLAIVFNDELISAPTIVDWELEELTFKGIGSHWPDVAETLVARLGSS